MKNSLLIAAAIMSISGAASAGTDTNVTITGVGCGASGTCFANVTPPITQSCTNNNQVRWDGNTSAGKNFTASALTARAGELLVNIGTIDGQCSGAFPVVNFITVTGSAN